MKLTFISTCILMTGLLVISGCNTQTDNSKKNKSDARSQAIINMKRATDHHSYSKPDEAVVTHLQWDAHVDFETRTINATANYEIKTSEDAKRILFDIRELDILSVRVDGIETSFDIGDEQAFIGSPLSIPLSSASKSVSISYNTQPGADAFLWVEGSENSSSRSKRPGRRRAGSTLSGRLVAPTTTTCPRLSKPSISASRVLTCRDAACVQQSVRGTCSNGCEVDAAWVG